MFALLASSAVQASSDVSFVPTSSSAARAALEWVGVGPDDVVYELGCGDGRVAAEAVGLGATAVCVERDPELAAQAKERMLRAAGDQPGRVKVLVEDLFKVNVSEATVVYVFLLPDLNARLRPALSAQLRTGARVVSAEFQVVGWPCGARLRTEDGIFHSWLMPVTATGAELDEDAVVEHLLECVADDAIDADGQSDPADPSERSSTFVERIVFARLGAIVEALGATSEAKPEAEREPG